jgi:thiol-disulfide isomerase/thioredoxin
MAQMLVPHSLSMITALGVGVLEALAGVLLLVPRFRRWGAWLTAFLLVVFMVYIGVFYNRLIGDDCSCFPWIERAVGPMFFISDAAMLVLAYFAGKWAQRSYSRRSAALVLAAITVFALVSYGMTAARRVDIQAPPAITLADGSSYSLQQGRIFVYFFNPECSHCDAAARRLAELEWGDTGVVSVSTDIHQFGQAFVDETGMPGAYSQDIKTLRQRFQFVDPPYAVAIEDGRQVAAYVEFEEDEPAENLREIGFVK